MVLTTPYTNLKSFIITKPPLVLFTLCLIAFAITTFGFAYYVEHKEDLPNVDAHRDYVSFLTYLSKQKLCISTNQKSVTSFNGTESEELIEVSVMAQYDLIKKFRLKPTRVQGYVLTSNWMSECSPDLPTEKVKLTFNLPEQSVNATQGSMDVCVTITGPKRVLGPASGPGQKRCVHSDGTKQVILGQIVSSIRYESGNSCPNGVGEVLLKYQPNDHNAVILTLHDRSIINLHLFHTSYFLLVMAITLICYAMIKGKNHSIEKLSSSDA